jgi:hypothetical protein
MGPASALPFLSLEGGEEALFFAGMTLEVTEEAEFERRGCCEGEEDGGALTLALTAEEEGVFEKKPSRVDCLPVEDVGVAFLGAILGKNEAGSRDGC